MTYLKRDARGQLTNEKRFNVKRGWPTGDHLEQNAEFLNAGTASAVSALPGQIVHLEENLSAPDGKVFNVLGSAWDGSQKLYLVVEGSEEFTSQFTSKGTAIAGPIAYEVDDNGYDGVIGSYAINDKLTVEGKKVKKDTGGDPIWGRVTGKAGDLLEVTITETE